MSEIAKAVLAVCGALLASLLVLVLISCVYVIGSIVGWYVTGSVIAFMMIFMWAVITTIKAENPINGD